MDLCLWLMASTCAGYDDDAEISCEHGGEGGKNVSISMLLFFSQQLRHMKTRMTGGGGGSCRCCCSSFLLRTPFFFFFISHLHLVYHSVIRGSLEKAGRGRREPPAVAFGSRNAA